MRMKDKNHPFPSQEDLQAFCTRHHIRKLLIFGSHARGDARDESDIDILVEFEPGHTPGFGFMTIQQELSQLFGRNVDLHTPHSLSSHIRSQALAEAVVEYVRT